MIAEAVNLVVAVVKAEGRRFVKDVLAVHGFSPHEGYRLTPL